MKGYELRIIDGNHLSASEKRLTEFRLPQSGPLPEQALVVLDPRRKLMREVICCEDALSVCGIVCLLPGDVGCHGAR
jgi:hypothetical protein